MSQRSAPDWMQPAALVRAWDELMASRASARRNPPPRGVDGMGPAAFEARKLHHCAEVSRILLRPGESAPTAYRFAPLVEHERETEPGKIRRVYIPRIRDQVVLRCVYQNLANAMRADGLRGSLENPQAVVRKVIHSRQRGHPFAARLDVRGFYDSVDHSVLSGLVAGLPLDEVSASLLTQLVCETPHRPFRGTRDDNTHRSLGLPTGTSVSTLLAELYLRSMDAAAATLTDIDAHRFVDDVVLLGSDEASLQQAVRTLADAAQELQLELHGNKTHFSSFARGFDFLGFRFESTRLLVASDRIHKWKRRFETLQRSTLRAHADVSPQAQLKAVTDVFHREISSSGSRHIGYYAIADDLSVYQEVDRYLSRVLGGLARRAKVPLELESCHAWAWRYKKDPEAAAILARARFPI